jgi:hypothetical protein
MVLIIAPPPPQVLLDCVQIKSMSSQSIITILVIFDDVLN